MMLAITAMVKLSASNLDAPKASNRLKAKTMVKMGLVFFIILTVSNTVYADDLLSIYQQALEADPELRSSETKIKIGTAQKGQALGQMLPQVTGTANWSGNSQNQFNQRLRRDQSTDYSGTRYIVSLNQTLIDFPKFWAWKKAQATESQYTLEKRPGPTKPAVQGGGHVFHGAGSRRRV
jgi:outer membrane protein